MHACSASRSGRCHWSHVGAPCGARNKRWSDGQAGSSARGTAGCTDVRIPRDLREVHGGAAREQDRVSGLLSEYTSKYVEKWIFRNSLRVRSMNDLGPPLDHIRLPSCAMCGQFCILFRPQWPCLPVFLARVAAFNLSWRGGVACLPRGFAPRRRWCDFYKCAD